MHSDLQTVTAEGALFLLRLHQFWISAWWAVILDYHTLHWLKTFVVAQYRYWSRS